MRFRFNDEAAQRVQTLQKRHGMRSEGEVILRALAFLEKADELDDDGVVALSGKAADGTPKEISVRVWTEQEAASG